MSDITRDQAITFLSGLTVLELSALVTELEEKWDVVATTGSITVTPVEPGPVGPVQTEFDVVLTSFGDKKIQVIKTIRGITGLGLKDAKALVETTPTFIKEGVSEIEAEEIVGMIEEAGGHAMAK